MHLQLQLLLFVLWLRSKPWLAANPLQKWAHHPPRVAVAEKQTSDLQVRNIILHGHIRRSALANQGKSKHCFLMLGVGIGASSAFVS